MHPKPPQMQVRLEKFERHSYIPHEELVLLSTILENAEFFHTTTLIENTPTTLQVKKNNLCRHVRSRESSRSSITEELMINLEDEEGFVTSDRFQSCVKSTKPNLVDY